ncbi:MAG TPA: hypothetical protein VK698_15065 [Kofleriaceae bacterium]|nr:hypothetical protein [Kofleriaceae bacterium]
MKDTSNQYSAATWDAARGEMIVALRKCAARRGMICYSDMLKQITSIRFELDDIAYGRMLGEVSEMEDAQGRGMLSAIVVHKVGDQEPGHGFFDLAAQLGRDIRDRLRCWTDEVKLAHDVWANRKTNINVTP